MDFPSFFIDHFGTRLTIGLIAGLHVLINHPLAVGAYPLLALMEYWGIKQKSEEWDQLAYKVTFVAFIITTTVGALTGVGIWLSTSLAAPFAIGSLLRIFFWGWFAEWLVFISEVLLIMLYFLTWKRWRAGAAKKFHLKVGVALAIMSWLTMALIVAVLAFMMDSGGWKETRGFWSAFFNPLYIPQLAFRTTYAMMSGGFFVLFCVYFFTKEKPELRAQAVTRISCWSLTWAILCFGAGCTYLTMVPENMQKSIPVGIMTQQFAQWQDKFSMLLLCTISFFLGIGLWGFVAPKTLPRWSLILPLFLSVWLLGHFERVREFIRKPYVIAGYMYSNGIRKDEVAMLQVEGILKYATYVKYHEVTKDNEVEAGHDVFMISCSRCHTSTGMNGVLNKFETLYGKGDWDSNAMKAFLATMHITRPYMPPFPGNDKEAGALVAYLQTLRKTRASIAGAQSDGIQINPLHTQAAIEEAKRTSAVKTVQIP